MVWCEIQYTTLQLNYCNFHNYSHHATGVRNINRKLGLLYDACVICVCVCVCVPCWGVPEQSGSLQGCYRLAGTCTWMEWEEPPSAGCSLQDGRH